MPNKENLNPVQSKSEAREIGNPKERSGCPCHGGGVLEDFAGVFLLVKRLPVSSYLRAVKRTEGTSRKIYQNKNAPCGTFLFWCTFRDSNPGPID